MNPVYWAADRLRAWARRRRWNTAQALGRLGEDVAHRHLQKAGLVIVARNYKTPGGSAEVDLVAREGSTLVFVEVKARESSEFGSPDRAIDAAKRDKIRRAAANYLRRSGHDPAFVRYDVVSVVMGPPRSVEHQRDAWRP